MSVLHQGSRLWSLQCMLDKVMRLADLFPSLTSFYTDITEEPLIAGQFMVYSGPTVLLLMNGKEVYRGSQFIDLEELEYNINRFLNYQNND